MKHRRNFDSRRNAFDPAHSDLHAPCIGERPVQGCDEALYQYCGSCGDTDAGWN